jgi:heme exporter protein C
MNKRSDTTGLVLAIASAAAIFVALGMVFLYAPREINMGDVQRIFYFHVGSAWVGFGAFAVTLVAGVAFLARGARRWDNVALASVEIGLTFITMTVLTSSLWARATWGTFWTWEPRLTISAVQLLIYVAYLMLRGSVESPLRAARLASVYGIAAFVTVPLSFFAIRWWRTIHPDILTGGGGMAITPRMVYTLIVALGAFTLLYITLLRARLRLATTADALAELRLRVERTDR